MEYWGNIDILNEELTAYLCSQRFPAEVILKSYDWAREQREVGSCIVCGNHSSIEKDVFEILLKGDQPLVLVLARGLKTKWKSEIYKAVEANRLLVISPYKGSVTRVTRDTAAIRNKAIIEISQKIVVGYATPGGQIDRLLNGREYEVLNNRI